MRYPVPTDVFRRAFLPAICLLLVISLTAVYAYADGGSVVIFQGTVTSNSGVDKPTYWVKVDKLINGQGIINVGSTVQVTYYGYVADCSTGGAQYDPSIQPNDYVEVYGEYSFDSGVSVTCSPDRLIKAPPPSSCTMQLADHTMAKDVQRFGNFDPIDRTYTFSTTDAKAVAWLKIGDVCENHVVRWEFYDPNNSMVGSTESRTDRKQPWLVLWGEMDINGHEAAKRPGPWNIKVFLDGQYLYREDFTIIGPSNPILQVSSGTLHFSAQEGGSNPSPQTVSISNSGGGTLNWSISTDVPWLVVTPASGTGNASLSVFPKVANLGSGEFQGTITVSAPGAEGSPKIIQVTLSISGYCRFYVSPNKLSFEGKLGGTNPPDQFLDVTSSCNNLSFTAGTNRNWFSISQNQGTAPANIRVHVNLAGLESGTYEGTITVETASANPLRYEIPISLTVGQKDSIEIISTTPAIGTELAPDPNKAVIFQVTVRYTLASHDTALLSWHECAAPGYKPTPPYLDRTVISKGSGTKTVSFGYLIVDKIDVFGEARKVEKIGIAMRLMQDTDYFEPGMYAESECATYRVKQGPPPPKTRNTLAEFYDLNDNGVLDADEYLKAAADWDAVRPAPNGKKIRNADMNTLIQCLENKTPVAQCTAPSFENESPMSAKLPQSRIPGGFPWGPTDGIAGGQVTFVKEGKGYKAKLSADYSGIFESTLVPDWKNDKHFYEIELWRIKYTYYFDLIRYSDFKKVCEDRLPIAALYLRVYRLNNVAELTAPDLIDHVIQNNGGSCDITENADYYVKIRFVACCMLLALPNTNKIESEWSASNTVTISDLSSPKKALVVSGQTRSLAIGYQLIHPDTVMFTAEGPQGSCFSLDVYDLNGRRMLHADDILQPIFRWTLVDEDDRKIATGVYLYVVTVKTPAGQLLGSRVNKLVILR